MSTERYFGCEITDDPADIITGYEVFAGSLPDVAIYVWDLPLQHANAEPDSFDGAPSPGAATDLSTLRLAWSPTQRREIMDSLAAGTYDTANSGALYAEIPGTAWGAYCGTTVDRANYWALLERFGSVFVKGYSYASFTLLIRVDSTFYPADLSKVVHALEEYPVVDDQAHSKLEQDLARDAWNQFGKTEFLCMTLGALQFGDVRRWPEADLDADSAFYCYMDSRATDWYTDTANERPKDPHMPSGNPAWNNGTAYQCESATGADFPKLELAAALFANRMIAEYSGHPPLDVNRPAP